MALQVVDRVRDTTTTTGTGAVALANSPPLTYVSFGSACSVGDTIYYSIQHQTLNEWENGLGTYSATNTLTRTTVLSSSNGGAAVNFSAGTKDVYVNAPASILAPLFNASTLGKAILTGAAVAANLILAGPVSGGNAAPSFRSLVASDIPDISGTYAPLAGATFSGDVSFSGTTHVGLIANSLTTTQRDAIVSPANGSIIYNSTLQRTQKYAGGAWHSHARLDGDTFTGQIDFSGTSHAGLKLNNLTTTQQNALTAAAGQHIYNSTLNALTYYDGSAWQQLAALGVAQTWTAAQTIARSNIGTASTDGFVLQNAQPALIGAQQWSPRIHWISQGFATTPAASRTVEFIAEVRSVQGTTNPTGTWALAASINGGAYSDVLTASSSGAVTVASTALQFVSSNGGFTFPNASNFSAVANGLTLAIFDGGAAQMVNFGPKLGLGSAATYNNVDVVVNRDGAGQIGIRNGGTAASPVNQSLGVYYFYAGAADYQRTTLTNYLGDGVIGTEKAGTGSTGALRIMIGGTHIWQFSSSGHLLAQTGNTYDIGDSGNTNRPRNVYAAGNVTAGGFYYVAAGGQYLTTGRGGIAMYADGWLNVFDNASTGAAKLSLGGPTSANPMLKRNGAGFDARLADDSGYTNITAANHYSIAATIGDADTTLAAGTTLAYVTAAWTANRKVTLPLANTVPKGTTLRIMDASNYVQFRTSTFATQGSDTLNGASSATSNAGIASGSTYQFERCFVSDGVSGWATHGLRMDYAQYRAAFDIIHTFALNGQFDQGGLSKTILGFDSAFNAYVNTTDSLINFAPAYGLVWRNNANRLVGTVDLGAYRDSAGQLGIRAGGTAASPVPMAMAVYNFCVNPASDYERIFVGYSSNVAYIGTQKANTGGARALVIGTNVLGTADNYVGLSTLYLRIFTGGVETWNFSQLGHLTCPTDNTYDIGDATHRPRNVYIANSLTVGGSTTIGGAAGVGFGTGGLYPSAGGGSDYLLFRNNAGTERMRLNGAGLLSFGGVTSASPGLKPSSATLQVKLADDSAFTALQAKLTTDTAYTATPQTCTGYITLYDSTGTPYKVLVAA